MRCAAPARAVRSALLGLCLLLALAGCDTVSEWMGEGEPPPVPGERLSVISVERQLEPDPGTEALTVRLPPPYVNEDWPQSGGYPHHAMHHLAAADTLALRWRARIGSGTDDDGPALADARDCQRAGLHHGFAEPDLVVRCRHGSQDVDRQHVAGRG